MFEKIDLLHRLYPPYLLGARMVAWMIYEDVETYNAIVLQRNMVKVPPLAVPSSPHVPHQSAPGGPEQLGTPRVGPGRSDPSHRLGCLSEPPPKSPISLPLTL